MHSDHYHSLVNNSVFTLLIRIYDLKKVLVHENAPMLPLKVKESNHGNKPQTEEETHLRDSSNTDNNYKVNRTTFFLQVHSYQLQLCLHFKLTG